MKGQYKAVEPENGLAEIPAFSTEGS